MNPVVVMAMYGRRSLVEINLSLIPCQVVVAASIHEDFDMLRSLKNPNVQIVPTSNYPLGKKWQDAVDCARILQADPLIILGSDDFLSKCFIARACEMAVDHDFCFFDHWFIHDQVSKKQYSMRYNMMKYGKPPLGSGRIFSKAFLDRRSGQIFDTSLSVKLDDFAYENVISSDKILLNPEGMHVLAVKGRHESLNPLDRILSTESIDWTEEKNIDQYFNFEKPIKEMF